MAAACPAQEEDTLVHATRLLTAFLFLVLGPASHATAQAPKPAAAGTHKHYDEPAQAASQVRAASSPRGCRTSGPTRSA